MRLIELQCKDVVNIENGCKIGFVSDLEIDISCAKIQAIVIEQNNFISYLRFFKTPGVIVIPIENIVSIGKDVILVNICCE